MGVCVGIILTVLSVNVVKKLQDNKKGNSGEDTVKENVITRAEAYRLLSYLEYNKAKRENIPEEITYADNQMSDWYDTYVNAVWKMGLIDANVKVSPKEALTYRVCKELIDKLIMIKAEYQTVYTGLSFDFTKSEDKMLISDFLEVYGKLLETVPEENRIVKEETLLVLGKDVTEDSKNRMVTDLGKYYYLDAKNYVKYNKTSTDSLDSNANKTESESGAVKITGSNNTAADSEKTATENVAAEKSSTLVDQYMDKGIKVLVCDQEIIYIKSESTDKIIIHNVWIKNGKDLQVDTFINGIDKSFLAVSKLKTTIEKVIGDITIENQKVVKINVKPDMIQGKVLRSGKDFIEIEGYGKVLLEENYKIYKIYGELTMEPTGSILVGYENTDFIVSDGKISAALITESIKAENIRVLIKTTDYKDILHDKVVFTATSDFTVSTKKEEHSYKKGESVTIGPEDELFDGGRITVKTAAEADKIEILSIERSCGNPKYHGQIEITKEGDKLIVVNELALEEYLYAVIPSEMPTSYGIEALRVQAVCARSYAYRHLLANSLSEYGAHVDDSVTYQVYNNVAENEDSILAVKDTYGQVIEYNDEVIIAYYFSTSCGHTTDPSSVWANDVELPYLSGKLIFAQGDGEDSKAMSKAEDLYEDLSTEKSFEKFIKANDLSTYDSSFNWYRWKVTMDVDNIKKVIDNNLAARYNNNPDLILTMTSEEKGGKEAVFESIPVDTVGDIVDISVIKRESSGIISELLIEGSKNTIKVRTEYIIRSLLAPTYDKVTRQDESYVEKLSMLPSAFFMIDKKETGGKLSSIKLTGGGYGHGVGMSQNAVKTMADSGKEYEEIVSYFYKGTKMGFIYE